jgi:hypothetical protein
MRLEHSQAASQSLLEDLRSDRGMEWVPSSGHLTKIAVDASAPQLSYDLAIDASGQGVPSWVQAGFDAPEPIVVQIESVTWMRILAAGVLAVGVLLLLTALRRPAGQGRLTPLG